jgi:hypothetical protein
MLLDLVAERVTSSTWAQIEFDDRGRLAVRYPAAEGASYPSTCPLCARAGLGDGGLPGGEPVFM